VSGVKLDKATFSHFYPVKCGAVKLSMVYDEPKATVSAYLNKEFNLSDLDIEEQTCEQEPIDDLFKRVQRIKRT
jgi:hypothetical protein